MNLVQTWWDWCSQSLSHTFAGVTAPLLLIAGLAVILFYSGQDGDGTSALPPRSEIAGVCATGTTGATMVACATAPSDVQVATSTPVPPTPTPKPRTYTVQAGDTLSLICASEAPGMTLDACVDAVVERSQLGGPDEIFEGQSLMLPPAAEGSNSATSTQRPAATPTPVVVEEAPATETPEPESPSASLTAIGPTESVPEAEPTAEPTEEPAEDSASDDDLAGEGGEYVVEAGDSLLGICVNEVPDMDEDECIEFLVLLNDLSGPDEVRSGQVLFLP